MQNRTHKLASQYKSNANFVAQTRRVNSAMTEPEQRFLNAAVELLAVAEIRGDDELPHPWDDEKPWTARMQDAWLEFRKVVELARPGAVHHEKSRMSF